jgi:hypothetical protein
MDETRSRHRRFLIQLLLPVRTNHRQPIDEHLFARVRSALAERFGGVTAYQRSPASGLWKRPDGEVDGDEVIMVEVEVEELDHLWWNSYRRQLEIDFGQERILVRAIRIDSL